MTDKKPQVIDLSKSDDEEGGSQNVADEAAEHYPESVGDGENNEGGTGDVYHEARENAENEGDSENEDGTGNVFHEARENREDEDEDGETAKAFELKNFDLSHRFDQEKSFNDLKSGDVVLIDTPLHGGKIGEVTGKEDAWTGTLHVKVDTGANEYDITPYNDDYSEKYVGCISEEGSLSSEILSQLGKTSIDKLEVGNQIILDVPRCGPVRGTVSNKTDTETQGTKIAVSTGPATFSVYEEPSPAQKKEQAIIVGQVQ
jgi:hypothetical protein